MAACFNGCVTVWESVIRSGCRSVCNPGNMQLYRSSRRKLQIAIDIFCSPLYYNNEDMHTIYDCVNSFCSLLDMEYHLLLGRKGVAVELGIRFSKKDCFHIKRLQQGSTYFRIWRICLKAMTQSLSIMRECMPFL